MSDETQTEPVDLYMRVGNLGALLQAHEDGTHIAVQGISIRRDTRSDNGVRLLVSMSADQRREAEDKYGFTTGE